MPVETIEWSGGIDGCIRLIDQTLLPEEFKKITCRDVESVWHAIRELKVRGAPAIGCAAALGTILGIQQSTARNFEAFYAELDKAAEYLATSRPTAVNLFWALERMTATARANREAPIGEIKQLLLDEALAIVEEDRAMCRRIGANGQSLIPDGSTALTHCNAGGLATSGYGTALACFFAAKEAGKRISVYADETRPLLQGSRLTAWELMQSDIDVSVICDDMAAQVMKEGRIDLVLTGADRIAANGDAANKIGTYGLAVLARYHGIPFYIAAPSSTFDLSLPNGSMIPIEERDGDEIACGFGRRTAPEGVKTYNPAFDVTPADLIEAIITEHGVVRPVDEQHIAETIPDVTKRPAARRKHIDDN